MEKHPVTLLAAILVWGLALPAPARTQHAADSPAGVHLVISREVAVELGALADTSGVETVRCLIGVRRGGMAVVDLVWEPPIQASPHEIRYAPCPMATIALWHNHPWPRQHQPEHACYLSRTDIEEALGPRAPPIQIVQVTAGVACWWTRAQVELGAGADALLPFAGQRRGKPVSATSSACRAGSRRLGACALLRVESAPKAATHTDVRQPLATPPFIRRAAPHVRLTRTDAP